MRKYIHILLKLKSSYRIIEAKERQRAPSQTILKLPSLPFSLFHYFNAFDSTCEFLAFVLRILYSILIPHANTHQKKWKIITRPTNIASSLGFTCFSTLLQRFYSNRQRPRRINFEALIKTSVDNNSIN